MPRIGLLAVLFGALIAGTGRACVVADDALPAPGPDAIPMVFPQFPEAGADAVLQADEWNPLTGVLALSSNVDFGPANEESVPPDPPTPPGLLPPILLMLAGGAVWRLYTSPAYVRMYRGLFGPLNQY